MGTDMGKKFRSRCFEQASARKRQNFFLSKMVIFAEVKGYGFFSAIPVAISIAFLLIQ